MTTRQTGRIAAIQPARVTPGRATAGKPRALTAAPKRSRWPLPAGLRARLQLATAGVVAPIGAGLNVQALRDWAGDQGWAVSEDPPAAGLTQWIWCPARRSELTRLAPEHADALVLGEGTVKTHVEHIIGKLGVSDRVQAAVWAARHGLAADPEQA